MHTELREVMHGAEGRYLSSDEIDRVMGIVNSYEDRFAIMKKLELNEIEIVNETIERMFEKYPDFYKDRPNAYDKCVRDESLVLRYAAMAMVNNDPEIFEEKVLYWMKTVVQSMEFTEEAKFTYTYMQTLVTRALGEKDAPEINRYLQMMVDIMDE
jgi:hypothetical protein